MPTGVPAVEITVAAEIGVIVARQTRKMHRFVIVEERTEVFALTDERHEECGVVFRVIYVQVNPDLFKRLNDLIDAVIEEAGEVKISECVHETVFCAGVS